MRHDRRGKLCVAWVNLNKESREQVLQLSNKVGGAIIQSQNPDPAVADAMLEFNLAMLGLEIVEGGLGYTPSIGDLIAPHPLYERSWQMPAYIIPMNL